jgi:hypothetical protein
VDPVSGVAADDDYEVAVDEATYRPLYVRSRSHGRIVGGSAVRVLSIDTRASLPHTGASRGALPRRTGRVPAQRASRAAPAS